MPGGYWRKRREFFFDECFCHFVSHQEPATRDAKNQRVLTPVTSIDEHFAQLLTCFATIFKRYCFHFSSLTFEHALF